MNIAIIKFSALGDLATIEPFIDMFEKTDHNITLVTSKIGYEYYKDHKNIKFIILKNKNNFFELSQIFIKLFYFDKIIDLQGNDRSKILTFFKRRRVLSNYVKNYKEDKCVGEDAIFIKSNSILEKGIFSVLNKLTFFKFKYSYFIPKKKTYIVVNAGSSPAWISKRLPNEKWKEIITILYNKYKLKIILTGDKSEKIYLDTIVNDNADIPIENLAGETTILELKEILKNAFLTVSTDSAAMHMSAVMKTPTIGLFGPTNWIKSAPYGPWSTVVYDKIYFKDGIPLSKNSQETDNYFDNINISSALNKLERFL